jgi:peptide/nickel transport system permease protein
MSGASGPNLRTLAATLVNALVVAVFVVVITFFLIRYALGDPAYQYALHQNGGIPPSASAVQAARVQLGINSPILSQFWHYITGLLHGYLGRSFQPGGQPVATLIWSGFSTTLVLSGITVLISAVLGTLAGLWLAVTRSGLADNLVRIIAMGGITAPPALAGLALIWLNSALGYVLPAGGWGTATRRTCGTSPCP